jgi:hypothetical protein
VQNFDTFYLLKTVVPELKSSVPSLGVLVSILVFAQEDRGQPPALALLLQIRPDLLLRFPPFNSKFFPPFS